MEYLLRIIITLFLQILQGIAYGIPAIVGVVVDLILLNLLL